MKPIQVIIVDDHKLVRDCIKISLASSDEIEIVEEAPSKKEALAKIAAHPTLNVAILDISLGENNGVEITQIITQKYPHIKVLALSMHNEISHIVDMIEGGAMGYILKNTGMQELTKAIKIIATGENYFSQGISSTLMNYFIRKKGNAAAGRHSAGRGRRTVRRAVAPSPPGHSATAPIDLEHLTEREIEILRLIAEEHTKQEIADKLSISPRTVDTHRHNLILKLEAKNTAGLVRFAIKHKLVQL